MLIQAACPVFGPGLVRPASHLAVRSASEACPEQSRRDEVVFLSRFDRRLSVLATREMYAKGLLKIEEYLRLRLNRPAPEKKLDSAAFFATLPTWLVDDLRRCRA